MKELYYPIYHQKDTAGAWKSMVTVGVILFKTYTVSFLGTSQGPRTGHLEVCDTSNPGSLQSFHVCFLHPALWESPAASLLCQCHLVIFPSWVIPAHTKLFWERFQCPPYIPPHPHTPYTANHCRVFAKAFFPLLGLPLKTCFSCKKPKAKHRTKHWT